MTDNRPLYVLCDTNATVRDAHLFRKKDGPLLIAILRAKKAKLVVPDALRQEYVSQFGQAADEALQKATGDLDRLKTLCGYDISALLPKAQFGEAQALEILARLEDIIHVVPISDELKVAAANRALNNVRPTSKSDHGFKDCLIWESLLTLPAGSEVLFLSRDEAAFFDGDKLAPNLMKDAEDRGLFLTAFSTTKNPSLKPLVDFLKTRFADVAASIVGELPITDHPIIQARMNPETVAPFLPQDPAAEESSSMADAPAKLEKLFAAHSDAFAHLDMKALGFVSFLKSTRKQDVTDLLVQTGAAAETVGNALDRLVLMGLIKDTGHHYLAVAGELADMATQLAEPDMIRITGLGG